MGSSQDPVMAQGLNRLEVGIQNERIGCHMRLPFVEKYPECGRRARPGTCGRGILSRRDCSYQAGSVHLSYAFAVCRERAERVMVIRALESAARARSWV
jgi:hypothetical protein